MIFHESCISVIGWMGRGIEDKLYICLHIAIGDVSM